MNSDSSQINLTPELSYFALIGDRQSAKTIGILREDRRRHVYVLGKTGMGKTTLLENMALQDIYNGYGVCFIDPHGDSSQYILDRIPKHRQNDVIYLDPADTEFPVGFNILESQSGEQKFLIASSLMSVFYRIWAGTWSSRMEYILNNTLLALLETPGHTLLGVIKMLTDEKYRDQIVTKLTDPVVRNFWQKEFATFNSRYMQEAVSPILNKIGQFFSSEIMRNILGQTHSTINLRQIMDEQKILIVNLSKGRLGEDNSNLFGSLLVAKLQTSAMSRVDISEKKRADFFVYVDEFQNFTTDSFAAILSEARKYRLNLILAHQYISQLTESGNEKVKNAVFGNVGTTIAFRLGAPDAEYLSREFKPKFAVQDLVSLDPAEIVIKLSVKGKVLPPFKARTLAPIFNQLDGSFEFIREFSRQKYAQKREIVAEQISEWFSPQTEYFEQKHDNKGKKGKGKNGNLPENQIVQSDQAEKSQPDKNQNPDSQEKTDGNPAKKPVEKSENILAINTKKVSINRRKLKEELQFSKKIENDPSIAVERIKTYQAGNDDQIETFDLP